MTSPATNPARRTETARSGPITVLLVDDHAVVRTGLRALLETQSGIKVVGEVADGRKAVETAQELDPDVVVMDIAMPRLNGIDAAAQIREVAPRTRVVLLSAHGDDAYIERVLALGDVGYVLKRSPLHHLLAAIRAAASGEMYLSPAIRHRIDGPMATLRSVGPPGADHLSQLTPRQLELLQLIAEGMGNKEVARELGISVKTVEKHRQNVMRKLDLHDVAGLVRFAVSSAIVECRHPESAE